MSDFSTPGWDPFGTESVFNPERPQQASNPQRGPGGRPAQGSQNPKTANRRGSQVVPLRNPPKAAWKQPPEHPDLSPPQLRSEDGARSDMAKRPPVVAGQFYPGNKERLQDEVLKFLQAAPSLGLRSTRAIIAPHAGYIYSGSVAGHAFGEVNPEFRNVFLLANNHNGEARYSGVSTPQVTHYSIPGADIPLSAICDELLQQDPELFTSVPEAHVNHMLEVELPFLHTLKKWPEAADYAIIPLVLSSMNDAQVEKLAELLSPYTGPGNLFVVSSDLSHYESDAEARKKDNATLEAIVSGETDRLGIRSCCGCDGVKTIMRLAQKKGWEATLLRYANSGDVSGDKNRVVGYGAVAFTEALQFTPEEEHAMLQIARFSVEGHLRTGRVPQPQADLMGQFPLLNMRRGVFVTIMREGKLRGCIGNIKPVANLYKGIIDCAISAATKDTRFKPVTADELPLLSYSISVLQHPVQLKAEPEDFPSHLNPGKDGVILVINGRQSTFLPQVWEQISDPVTFLNHLARKQGAPEDAWKNPGTRLYTYGAASVGK